MSADADRHTRVASVRAETRNYLAQVRARRLARQPRRARPDPDDAAPSGPVNFTAERDVAALVPVTDAPEPPPIVSEPEALAAAPETPPEPVREPAATAPARPGRPLSELALFGQGIIWRLNNLGIQSLEDLAACDPPRLEASLGSIGRLVRSDLWVQAARQALAEA
jgi:predicted flap endonuclease-1-like 5' DNA nuclease